MPSKPKPVFSTVSTSTKSSAFRDSYFWFITTSWPKLVGVLGGIFLSLNAAFALLYTLSGGIANVGRYDYVGYFFFSVHTLATVGYGNAYPVLLISHCLVALEIMCGIFMITLITGLMFSKFSRPTAKVIFSRSAVINNRDGHPHLSFRLANERGSTIAEAQLSVSVLKDFKTSEGESLRKLYDLKLDREKTPLFILSWTVFHKIDENSPLYGLDEAAIINGDMQIIISMTGFEPILGQTVHTRHMYWAKDIEWGKRFKDALTRREKHLHLDYGLFHETT